MQLTVLPLLVDLLRGDLVLHHGATSVRDIVRLVVTELEVGLADVLLELVQVLLVLLLDSLLRLVITLVFDRLSCLAIQAHELILEALSNLEVALVGLGNGEGALLPRVAGVPLHDLHIRLPRWRGGPPLLVLDVYLAEHLLLCAKLEVRLPELLALIFCLLSQLSNVPQIVPYKLPLGLSGELRTLLSVLKLLHFHLIHLFSVE